MTINGISDQLNCKRGKEATLKTDSFTSRTNSSASWPLHKSRYIFDKYLKSRYRYNAIFLSNIDRIINIDKDVYRFFRAILCSKDKEISNKRTPRLADLFHILPVRSKLEFEARNLIAKLKRTTKDETIAVSRNMMKNNKHARRCLRLSREGKSQNKVKRLLSGGFNRKRYKKGRYWNGTTEDSGKYSSIDLPKIKWEELPPIWQSRNTSS